jgi:hypothetical protein
MIKAHYQVIASFLWICKSSRPINALLTKHGPSDGKSHTLPKVIVSVMKIIVCGSHYVYLTRNAVLVLGLLAPTAPWGSFEPREEPIYDSH